MISEKADRQAEREEKKQDNGTGINHFGANKKNICMERNFGRETKSKFGIFCSQFPCASQVVVF